MKDLILLKIVIFCYISKPEKRKSDNGKIEIGSDNGRIEIGSDTGKLEIG